jgi:hypothetical protein
LESHSRQQGPDPYWSTHELSVDTSTHFHYEPLTVREGKNWALHMFIFPRGCR